MMPMSGESVVEIQHFIPESFHTDISLYAVTGEKVATIFSGIAPTELTKIQHPLTNLPKGVYYCELRTGAFRKTIPIVITQWFMIKSFFWQGNWISDRIVARTIA